MTADAYLNNILIRESVSTGIFSPVRKVQAVIQPIIQGWAGRFLANIHPSGSFAKGTAIKSGTDIDLFISLTQQTPETLQEIYDSLFNRMSQRGYSPKRQNVSINIMVNGYSVDLVPAKRQDGYSHDHSLYRRKASTWTKTNVKKHVNYVNQARRINETKVIKLWRNQKGLDFPSFYLELTVINALSGQYGTFSERVFQIFRYLQDTFPHVRVNDPANTNNIISDDLTIAEKAEVKKAAAQALKATNWNQIII